MKEDRKLQALLQEIQRGELSEEDVKRVLELVDEANQKKERK